MPFAHNHGVKIYWDEQGSGPPVVLIMGLTCPSDVWCHFRASVLDYRTIALDNRCAARSDTARCTIAAMASDVAAVMDAAGVRQAHIVGASLGGIVAQEFALKYPQRVRGLVLACTLTGGAYAMVTKFDLMLALIWRALQPPANAIDAFVPFLYHPETPRERIDAELKVLKRWAPSRVRLASQLLAIATYRSLERLPNIAAPTLVLHGDSDRLVPLSNGKLIANRIPGAELVIIPRAGHMLHTDQPELTYEVVRHFLRRVDASMPQEVEAGPSA